MGIDLDGKVGIITGAAQGIGRAYALGCAAAGARIVVADVQDGAATVAAVRAAGGEAVALRCDVSAPGDADAVVAETTARYGGLDFLVNNAAIYAGLRPGRFTDIDVDEWDRVMAVNVRGVFLCCRAAAPVMVGQRRGSIVNVSSGTVHMGVTGLLHYVTSKSALIGMTRSLARELGPRGVRVNALTPGLIGTEASAGILGGLDGEVTAAIVGSQAMARLEQPDDLVGTVVFLASDASSFMTGQTINVDGGWAHV